MRILRYPTIALLVAGCSNQAPPTSLDIYYRPFSATSYVRLTEPIMLTSAGSQAKLINATEISRVLQSLPRTCEPSDMKEADMDLRLLIYMNYADRRETWKAGVFSYYDSRIGKMCKMSQELEDQVEAPLSKLRT